MAAAAPSSSAAAASDGAADAGLPVVRRPQRDKAAGIGGLPTAASKSLKAEVEESEMIRCSVTGERVHNSEYTPYQRRRYDLDSRRCRAGTTSVHRQLASQHRRYFSAHGISHKDAWSAIRDHNFAFVYDALHSGFPISQRDKYTGRTMLHEAASMGDLELCELLLEWEGSDVGSRCLVGRDTAIHFAAIGGNWKVIDMLALYGARINDTDKFALTPLHMATSMEVVKHLIRHGADERIHDSFGRTPGMCAEDRGDTEIAELLGEVSLRRMQKVHRQEQAKVVLAKQADKARAQRLALQAVKQAEKDKAQRLLALKEEYAAWRIPDGRAKARSTAKAKASTSIDGPKEHKALLAKYNRMARDAGRDSTLKSLGNSGTGSRG